MSPEREALFMCAAHCQGGHSLAGSHAAEALGVPFPIEMPALVAKARGEGVNPAALWPWLLNPISFDAKRYFTADEIEEARR